MSLYISAVKIYLLQKVFAVFINKTFVTKSSNHPSCVFGNSGKSRATRVAFFTP